MLGELTDNQIDQVLNTQSIGRIGCHAKNKTYIVPVTYAYHDGHIYVHSKEGLKIKIMRDNPDVCFQVDSIENMTNWRSVIVWGKYQELKSDQDQQHGMKILMDRLTPFAISETVRPPQGQESTSADIQKGRLRAVAYRIAINEKTGRFEKSDVY